MPNRGQKTLNLGCEDEGGSETQVKAVFHITQVTLPLMSVSRICDQDLTAHFDKHRAVVKDAQGRTVCVFLRRGGLYACKMRLKRPFGRHA